MSDAAALFLILFAVYLFQCIVWVPEAAVVFRRSVTRGWRNAEGGLRSAALGLRAVLAPVFPPLGGILVSERWPVQFSPQGFWRADGRGAPRLPPHFAFDQAGRIDSDGAKITCGGLVVAETASPASARRLAALLTSLQRSGVADRSRLIQAEWARALDTGRASLRLSRYRYTSRLLRWECNLLFLYILVLAPLLIELLGFLMTWKALAAGLVPLVAHACRQFYRLHKCHLREEGEARWKAAVTIGLSPPVAIRAADFIERDLLCRFHPLAVAALVCRAGAFHEMASRELRECRFPLPAEPRAEEEWFTANWGAAVENFVRRTIGDPQRLIGPPERESEFCLSYCPRCWSQFVVPAGVCPDCAGLPLRSFAPAQAGVPTLQSR